jgi:hypothetical protein
VAAGAGTFGGGCCGTCRPPVYDVVTWQPLTSVAS